MPAIWDLKKLAILDAWGSTKGSLLLQLVDSMQGSMPENEALASWECPMALTSKPQRWHAHRKRAMHLRPLYWGSLKKHYHARTNYYI
mmetsp:Transcript_26376/g.58009  ORF Transcript_26376/g.58009 Transcript_26376/m.58009 type:complete len:88 (-) Transcript_26376:12-275(-)